MKSKFNKGMRSSATDDWATPQEFFNKLDAEFFFEADVCASRENAKHDIFFSKEDDGLKQDWSDYACCFMNPPYGREIGKWVKKAAESGTKVVGLLPARTDTKWFHDYIYGRAEIRFVKGRLKFGGGFKLRAVSLYGRHLERLAAQERSGVAVGYFCGDAVIC